MDGALLWAWLSFDYWETGPLVGTTVPLHFSRLSRRTPAGKSRGHDLALWDRAVHSGSRRLHLWLSGANLPRETLESLGDQGATKTLRNRASEALRHDRVRRRCAARVLTNGL